jgi:hypothetical protein
MFLASIAFIYQNFGVRSHHSRKDAANQLYLAESSTTAGMACSGTATQELGGDLKGRVVLLTAHKIQSEGGNSGQWRMLSRR